VAKLLGAEGGSGADHTVILNALAEMEAEIKSECERRFAPLADF
jgi:hypothetical protein